VRRIPHSTASAVYVLVGWVATAEAAEPKPSRPPFLPVRDINRAPTLPHHVFRLDIANLVSYAPANDTSVLATLGGGYGLTERVEMGFSLPALQLSPTVEGVDPFVYVTAGFTPNNWLTLIPLVRVTAPLRSSDLWTLDLNISAYLALAESVQLFTSPTYSISFADPLQTSISLPLGVVAQLTDRLFLQAQVGEVFDRVNPRVMAPRADDSVTFDETMLMVSGLIGYTVGGPDKTTADIMVTWLWPGLVQNTTSQTSVAANDWSLILSVSVYLPQLRRRINLRGSKRSAARSRRCAPARGGC
jgi:hypothetical protein